MKIVSVIFRNVKLSDENLNGLSVRDDFGGKQVGFIENTYTNEFGELCGTLVIFDEEMMKKLEHQEGKLSLGYEITTK